MITMFRKFFAIMTLMLLLFLSGCVEQVPEEPGFLQGSEQEPLDFIPVGDTVIPPEPAPIPGNCEAMERQVDKDTCIFATALEENDVSQCSNLSKLWQRNDCVSSVARQKFDTSLCEHMESAFGEDNTNAKNICIADVALGVLYTDECNQLVGESWEERCWGRVSAICSEIASGSWREVCIKKSAIESGDKEKCLQLHGFEKDTCLEEIAASYQNPAICDEIEDETIKESCLERTSLGVEPELE